MQGYPICAQILLVVPSACQFFLHYFLEGNEEKFFAHAKNICMYIYYRAVSWAPDFFFGFSDFFTKFCFENENTKYLIFHHHGMNNHIEINKSFSLLYSLEQRVRWFQKF